MQDDDDYEFADAVDGWLNAGNMGERLERLANEFEALTSTVARWARGSDRPRPSTRKQVIRYIRENP
jgi:hypothetical protein